MRELEEELVWRVRESRFTFRTDRGFVGEQRGTDSNWEEGRDGGGASSSTTTTVDMFVGGAILIPRLAGVFLLRGRAADCCVIDCITIRQEAKGSTTCVLFRKKKKEDIRQGRWRSRRAIDAQDSGALVETIEGRGSGCRECTAYLSNPAAHVATSAQPTPLRSVLVSGHSAGPWTPQHGIPPLEADTQYPRGSVCI